MIVQEYAIKVAIEGSQVVVKELKKVQKEEENLNKATKTDIANTNKRNKELKETNSLLWTYAKRLVGVYAIYKMFRKGIGLGIDFANQGNMLSNMSVMANTSAKSLQKWGYVLRRFGGNETSASNTIGGLNRRLYEYRNFGIEHFRDYTERYGALPAGTTAEQFLINVAKKMAMYKDRNAKLDIADKLNIDPATANFLMQGPKYVMEALKEAKEIYTSEDIEKAKKTKEAMIALNREFEKMRVTIGGIVLKPLTDVIKELTDFIKDPRKYIQKTFEDKEVVIEGKTEKVSIFKEALKTLQMFDVFDPIRFLKGQYGITKGISNVVANKNMQDLMNPSTNVLGSLGSNALLGSNSVVLNNRNEIVINDTTNVKDVVDGINKEVSNVNKEALTNIINALIEVANGVN